MARLHPAVSMTDHRLGKENAPVTLVEYGDFECPHCGLAHPLIKRLLRQMGDQLLFVYRYFPLQEIHPHAYAAALAAEAAGRQDKFWEMHDLIYENQRHLTTPLFLDLAGRLGLDEQVFARDWQSETVKRKVEADFESGIRSGVNGTPTFFVNGAPFYQYDETYASLEEAVQIAL